MDSQKLQQFFDRVSQVIGEDNVSLHASSGGLEGPSGSTAYGDPFASATNRDPSGAVRPKNVEEVREIVRLANRFDITLWTVSRGKNLGYVKIMQDVDASRLLSELTNSLIQLWRLRTSRQGNCCTGPPSNEHHCRNK
jgi:FAD/FMN-containing dehydrogenase